MNTKHTYSFTLYSTIDVRDHNSQVVPFGTFVIKNYFDNFPTTLDIANYIKNNKDLFFKHFYVIKTIEVIQDYFLYNSAFIRCYYERNDFMCYKDFYINNILKL